MKLLIIIINNNIVRDRDSLVAHIKRSLQVRTRALGYH